jgi:hypothetical protein
MLRSGFDHAMVRCCLVVNTLVYSGLRSSTLAGVRAGKRLIGATGRKCLARVGRCRPGGRHRLGLLYLTETTAAEVNKSLLDPGLRIHHERAVADSGFVDRLATQQ